MAFKPATKRKDDRGGRSLFKRRKFCRFSAEKIEEIDYKDVDILKDFITENAKIMPAPRHIISASCPPRSSAPASLR